MLTWLAGTGFSIQSRNCEMVTAHTSSCDRAYSKNFLMSLRYPLRDGGGIRYGVRARALHEMLAKREAIPRMDTAAGCGR